MSDQCSHDPERRIFRRTGLYSHVEIEIPEPAGSDSAALKTGEMVNVGLGGILARTDEHLVEGTLCVVRFMDQEAGSFEAKGCVRRSRTDENGVMVGIEFEAPVESVRKPSDGEQLDGFDLESMSILVVDDEPSIVELLYRFLTRRGCKVSTAGSGEEALRALREQPHDITVLDLKMPGMGGLEVLETIREENLDAGKIWAISGYATDDEARQALRLGAADFINKPLDLKYLEWSMQLHQAAS